MTNLAAQAVATGFDFSVPAEVYVGRGMSRRHGLRFRQFASAAEAIRFIVEQPRATGETAMMECDDQRYSNAQVAGLYEDAAYPLDRAAPKVVQTRPSIAIASPATKRALAEIPSVATTPVKTPATGHRHKYPVGTRLRMIGYHKSQGSDCSVVFMLPYEGGQVLYRVKSDLEGFERVVPETDLSPLAE